MCVQRFPHLAFSLNAGSIWADSINHLSGYMVTVALATGEQVHGELLGDGSTGRYLRLMTDDHRERTYLTQSVESITVE